MTYKECLVNLDEIEDVLIGVSGGYPYSCEEQSMLDTLDKAREAIREVMEKQSERDPLKVTKHYASFYFCPQCGMNLNPRFEEDYMKHISYCEKCGQKIYWKNSEEK